MTKAERQRLQGAVDDLPKWLAWRIAERITSWDRTQLADEQFVRLSDLCAALAACLAAEGEDEPPGWQPIKTALKDGLPMLLGYADGIAVGYWFQANKDKSHGWIASGNNLYGNASACIGLPTHWMLLPLPPVASKASPEGESNSPIHNDV